MSCQCQVPHMCSSGCLAACSLTVWFLPEFVMFFKNIPVSLTRRGGAPPPPPPKPTTRPSLIFHVLPFPSSILILGFFLFDVLPLKSFYTALARIVSSCPQFLHYGHLTYPVDTKLADSVAYNSANSGINNPLGKGLESRSTSV